MRPRTLLVAIAAAGLAGGGVIYAQPGGTASTGTPATGTPATGTPATGTPATGSGSSAAPAPDVADVALPTEKNVNLSPQEMGNQADALIKDMEGIHRHTLELRAAAEQAKDVIKLNCVNENLLAVKQLLNIADSAKNDFTEAKARGDRSEQVHQFSQVTIASEKAKEAGNEAQACIGEELHFVGKNDVQVTGPDVKHDPTTDGDVHSANGEDPYTEHLEDPGYASPFSPQ
jgi:hypothetical protein